MVDTYDQLKTNFGDNVRGRTKLFIVDVDDNGNIIKSYDGTSIIPEVNGTLFIVDDWLIPQIDKVQFVDGTLLVKVGEELIPPVKSDKELQIEAIERQLAALKAEPDEPAEIEEDTELPVEEPADTEEQTDAPLLDYTDEPTE